MANSRKYSTAGGDISLVRALIKREVEPGAVQWQYPGMLFWTVSEDCSGTAGYYESEDSWECFITLDGREVPLLEGLLLKSQEEAHAEIEQRIPLLLAALGDSLHR